MFTVFWRHITVQVHDRKLIDTIILIKLKKCSYPWEKLLWYIVTFQVNPIFFKISNLIMNFENNYPQTVWDYMIALGSWV